MFNNGSEVTLVRNNFCLKAGFKLQPATSTLAGVGGKAQTFSASNGGRILSIVLQDNDGKTKVIEALGVPKILKDTLGHGSYKAITKRFPGVNPKVFKELPEQKLDLLVSNVNLRLQPKCGTGSPEHLDMSSSAA